MDILNIDSGLIRQLKERAMQENRSVDDLLAHLLAAPSNNNGLSHQTENEALEMFRRNEARLRSFVETKAVYIVRIDLNGIYTYANQHFINDYSWLYDDGLVIGGSSVRSVVASDQEKMFEAGYSCLANPGEPVQVNLLKPGQDGSNRYTRWEFISVQDDTGAPAEIQCIGFDITKERAIEEAMRHSESRYRLLTELMSDYVILTRVEPDGSLFSEWTTGSFEDTTGYSLEGERKWRPEDYVYTEDLPALKDAVQRTISGQGEATVSEYRIRDGRGGTSWLRVSRYPVWSEAEDRVVRFYSIGQNITERKEAEEALRQSEARYRLLTELLSDYTMSVRVDADGEMMIEWLIGDFEGTTGFKNTSAPVAPSIEYVHPDDRERVQAELRRVLQNEPSVSEYRLITENENGPIWLSATRQPIWDDKEGRVVRFYSMVRNITERKQSEMLQLEQERLKANLKKEQEINTLIQQAISSISHDIRTPLSVINTSKDLLTRYFDKMDENKRREKLTTIGKQLNYVVELLDELSVAVKSGLSQRVFQPAEMNIDALCRLSIEEIRSLNPHGPQLNYINNAGYCTIYADETLITRILLNLLSNAIKYSPEDSEVSLELRCEREYITLRISDQGMGIAPADIPRIFEPFYRTENVRSISGTGLGLTIVKDCVDRHNGKIHIDSTPGAGTTITVKLPITPPETFG